MFFYDERDIMLHVLVLPTSLLYRIYLMIEVIRILNK